MQASRLIETFWTLNFFGHTSLVSSEGPVPSTPVVSLCDGLYSMRSAPPIISFLALFLLFGTWQALAETFNVTVDDTFGDDIAGRIVYSSDIWNDGRDCAGCGSKPNQSEVHRGTWTDSSFDGSRETVVQNATLRFNGSAVYVYCIIDVMGNADMVFFIDGQSVGEFVKPPTNSSRRYQYNVPVYVNKTLSNEPHTVTVQNGRVGGGVSTILLDYIVYSQGEPPQSPSSPTASDGANPTASDLSTSGPSSSSQSNTTSIIIGVCCALGGALVAVLIWWLRRYLAHRKQREDTLRRADPFTAYGARQGSQTSFSDGPRSPPSSPRPVRTETSMSSLRSPKSLEARALTRPGSSNMSSSAYTMAQSPTTSSASTQPVTVQAYSPSPRSRSGSTSRDPSLLTPHDSSVIDASIATRSSPLRRPITWDDSAMVYTEPPPSYS
ncbi:hypothetical protein HGRIS_001901 [Hohenbuehelia grisea]|uniref:Transmembrane protein n=1 Tax=Hohenbuehelia grisea TaxID=104357 RepID=A0ABR3JJ02_9AGAR